MRNLSIILLAVVCAFQVKAQYPLLNFSDIQFINDADLAVDMDLSYLDGDTVQVEGIVTMDPCDYALSSSGSRMGTFLQDPVGAPWGGLHILIDPGASGYPLGLVDLNNDALFVDNFAVGNQVRATGIVSSFDGHTQLLLLPIPSAITGFSTMPAPVVLTVDSFMQNDGSGGQVLQRLTGEKWEGVYVEIQNVFATDIVPSGSDRFFWDVSDGMGNSMAVRDMSGHFRNGTNDDECPDWLSGTPGVSNTPTVFAPPAEGANLAYIRGVAMEYLGEYFITPLLPTDIGPITTSPPLVTDIVRSPVVATSTDNVTVSATILDTDGTVTSAELFYSYGAGSTSFTAVAMSTGGGDTWTGVIPGPGTDSTVVNFYIRAEDNDMLVTYNPDSLATGSFYLTLDGGITSIVQIQKNETGFGSVWAGDSLDNVNIVGIVTAGMQTYDLGLLALQDGTDPWSGIFVQNSTGIETLFRGDEIRINSAEVTEQFGVTYLENIDFDLLSSGNPVPAPIMGLEPDTLGQGVFLKTEPYEGMLLRFDNAIVTSNNPDAPGGPFGEWAINVGSSTPESGLRVDDLSTDMPFEFGTDSVTLGETLSFIQGPLYFSFGNYKLVPRNLADIGGYTTEYPKAIVSFRFDDLIPTVNAAIDQDALTIEATVPAGTDVTILSPTVEFTGQSLSPETNTSQDFSSPLTYTVTAPIDGSTRDYVVTITVDEDTTGMGLDDLAGLADLTAFPNPTEGWVVLDLQMTTDDDLTVVISDLMGRTMQTSQLHGFAGNRRIQLDMSAYAEGTYFIEVRGATGSATRRVQLQR